MERWKELIAKARREGPRFKKPVVEVEKPSAEVIPLPTGTALAVAKEDRTSAEEISKAIAKAREERDRKEAERAERQARRDRENEEQRMEMLRNLNSEASHAAAREFNNRMGYYRGNHMNRDGWQGDD